MSRLKASLFGPYQREGVKWLVTHEYSDIKGGFLCDEMGLGKTIQMIATMCYNPLPNTLIIVPNSLVHQWIDEVKKFSNLTVSILTGVPTTQVSITTYSRFVKKSLLLPIIHSQKWDRVIMDEGHEVRNAKSQRFRNISDIKKDITWVLSGTPVYNSERDFRALTHLITEKNYDDIKREDIVLRRTKADVEEFNENLRLPECIFENIELERYPEEEYVNTMVYDKYMGLLNEADDMAVNMIMLEGLLRLRQIGIHPKIFLDAVYPVDHPKREYNAGSCKLDTLTRLIGEHPDEKTLIFTQFRAEMDIIKSMLPDRQVFMLDGRIDQGDRKNTIENFNKADAGAVFIIQIKTGGQGLNLQEATRIYITSPSWNPATELQAIGRSHRTGQKKTVVVKKLVYVKTEDNSPSIEESIVELQDQKSIVCAKVLNDTRLLSKIPKMRNPDMIKALRHFFAQ
jgi:SNF2 family DNA or RNA helicase